MDIVTQLPRQVREIENVFITLADGCRLAARIWLPGDAKKNPVPAILEYLPYRKDDGTAAEDYSKHAYFARRGYVGVRVDIRGFGSSEGTPPEREYSEREQLDGEQVIAWLAQQPWSNGNIGMFGISWGGFAALQMNAAVGLDPKIYGLGVGILYLGYFFLEVPSNLALERFGARRWIGRIMISSWRAGASAAATAAVAA